MLTPQEKIDEIYRILSRQESRRRWALFFTWLWRIVIITSIAIVVLYPGKTTEWMFRIAAPMIEQVVRQVIDTQKNSLTEWAQNMKNTIIDQANRMLPTSSQNNPQY